MYIEMFVIRIFFVKMNKMEILFGIFRGEVKCGIEWIEVEELKKKIWFYFYRFFICIEYLVKDYWIVGECWRFFVIVLFFIFILGIVVGNLIFVNLVREEDNWE